MGLFFNRKVSRKEEKIQFAGEDREEAFDSFSAFGAPASREPGFPDGPLPTEHRFGLGCQSISMVDGHAGHDIYYDPKGRQVVQETWLARDEFTDPETGELQCYVRKCQEYQPVPREITTTWELWRYLQKKQPTWLLDSF